MGGRGRKTAIKAKGLSIHFVYKITVSFLNEVVTSRLPEELVKKVDQAVLRGHFRSRSEALRTIVEEYLRSHPELFLGEELENLLVNSPNLSHDDLERVGSKLFEGLSVPQLVAEGRRR